MLLKNSFLYGALSILKGVFGFLLIIVYTRFLSPSAYGDFAVAVGLVGLVDSFAFLWVRLAVMRHITHAKTPDDAIYLSNATLIYALVAGICLVLSLIFSALGWMGQSGLSVVYQLLGLLVVTEAISNFFIALARIRLQHVLYVAMTLIKPLLSLGVGTVLILGGLDVTGAVTGMLAGCAIAGLIGFVKSDDMRHLGRRFYNPKILHDIMRFGLPLVGVLAVYAAMRLSDRLLLETLIGGDVTGLYAAAQDIPVKLLGTLALAINLAAYPLAVHALEHQNMQACRQQLRLNFTLLLGILCPAMLGMLLLVPALSNIFLGAEYRPFAGAYMGYFIVTAFLNCFIQYYVMVAFNLAKQTHKQLPACILALAVNVLIGLIAIPHWGVSGAIFGSVAAYITLFAGLAILSRGVFALPLPLKESAQIISASAVMAAFIYYAGFNADWDGAVLAVVLGGLVYGALIMAMNVAGLRGEMIKMLNLKIREAS